MHVNAPADWARGTSWAGMDESRSPVNRKICPEALGQLRLSFDIVVVPTLSPAPGMFPHCHTGGYSFTPLPGGIIPTSVVPPSLLFWKSADTYPPTLKVPPRGSVPDVGVAN